MKKRLFLLIILFLFTFIPTLIANAETPYSVCIDLICDDDGTGGGGTTSYTHYINTSNTYTVAASIMKMVETKEYNDNDIYKFYQILKELKDNRSYYDTTLKLKTLINSKGIYYTASSTYTNSQYIANPIFIYRDYNKIYVDAKLRIEAIGLNTQSEKTVSSDYDMRDLNEDQANYGYSSSYNPFYTFRYRSNIMDGESEITLIDDDKIYVYDVKYGAFGLPYTVYSNKISKYEHYNRNQYNYNFPFWKLDFENSDIFSSCSESISLINLGDFKIDTAYFHKLGAFNNDTSNLGNVKYTCTDNSNSTYPHGSYEVIYTSNGTIDGADIIEGTYNFVDGKYDANLHCNYDVYAYLLWGNSFEDNSLIKERLIWDENASGTGIWDFDGKLYQYRGSTLYSKGSYNSYINSTILNTLINRIE